MLDHAAVTTALPSPVPPTFAPVLFSAASPTHPAAATPPANVPSLVAPHPPDAPPLPPPLPFFLLLVAPVSAAAPASSSVVPTLVAPASYACSPSDAITLAT